MFDSSQHAKRYSDDHRDQRSGKRELNRVGHSLGQFLNYITLLEGGLVGVVMAALYKPLAEKNEEKISAIVKATDGFFKKIAKTFILYSLALSVVYPLFVKTSFSWEYVCTLSLIVSVSLFIQYFFSLTYRVLLNADQRGYIVYAAQIAFTLANFMLTVAAVKIYPNIHILKLATSLAYFIQPVVFTRYVRKHYRLRRDIEPDQQALRQRWDGFGQNLAYFIHTNTDVVVLTVCSTLTNVSVYAVYFMVANALKTLVMSVSLALAPSVGNVLVSADAESKQRTFDYYEFVIYTIATFSFVCGGILVTPFVGVYTAGVSDADYFQPLFGAALVLSEAIYCLRDPFVSVAYAAGHFKQTAKYAYIEAGLNITVSVALVSRFGLIGVAVGTAVSMLYRMIVHVIYLRNNILFRPVRKWAKSILVFSSAAVLSVLVCRLAVRMPVYDYPGWIMSACVTAAVVFGIMGLILFLCYRDMVRRLLSGIAGKLKLK